MPDLTWKPGPPPLDVFGRFDCIFDNIGSLRWIIENSREFGWIHDLGEDFDHRRLEMVKWHFFIPPSPITWPVELKVQQRQQKGLFGPIPSPPTGERE